MPVKVEVPETASDEAVVVAKVPWPRLSIRVTLFKRKLPAVTFRLPEPNDTFPEEEAKKRLLETNFKTCKRLPFDEAPMPLESNVVLAMAS